jgi:hypothetical protein
MAVMAPKEKIHHREHKDRKVGRLIAPPEERGTRRSLIAEKVKDAKFSCAAHRKAENYSG